VPTEAGEPARGAGVDRQRATHRASDGWSVVPLADAVRSGRHAVAVTTHPCPQALDCDGSRSRGHQARKQRAVVDDGDPARDLVEQPLRGVAAMVAEGAVVVAEETGMRGHRHQGRRTGRGEWSQLALDEPGRLGDVFEDVEQQHQIESWAGRIGGAHQPWILGGELERVVIDVPAHHLLGVGQIGEQRLAEPAVTGADVEHPTGTERAVVGEDPAVGAEALDLPRMAVRRRPAFGEIHAGGGYSLARRRSRDAVPAPPATMTQTPLVAEPRTGHGDVAGGRAERSDEPPSGWRWAARAAVLLPIAVAVVRALAHGWFPIGDAALLAIRGYDVATADHPLLGSWTSASFALGIDVNNPGPLYPDLLAPFMWTFGRAFGIGVATAIGVGTINAAAAIGTALVGARIGGWRVERWMLLLVAALTWSMGSELLIDIWQPHALLLPFCALVALTIAVACGDTIMLPVWVGVASLIVQTHVAYVYAVGVLVLVVVIALVLRLRAARGDDPWDAIASRLLRGKPFIWTVVVLALAWIQPVWEQLFGAGEGNLQRLATHAGEGDLTVGGGTAAKIVSAVVALPPWWTRDGFRDTIRNTPLTDTADGPRLFVAGLPSPATAVLALLVVFVLLGLLIAGLRRPSQRPACMACVVSAAMLAMGVLGLTVQAVTRTGLGSHQVRWLFALSVIVHVSILWGAVEWAAHRWPGGRWYARWLDLGVGVVLAALTIANIPFYAHDLGPTADRAAQATLERTFDDIDRFDPGGPVVYDIDNLTPFEPYSTAVMMRLREHGIEFRFSDEPMLRQMGEQRRVDGSEVAHVRQFQRAEALLFDGDACIVSMRSGLSATDEEAADALIAAAADDLSSGAVAVDVRGLPDDVAAFVQSATGGNHGDAFRIVVSSLLLDLVSEGRLKPTKAIQAAVDEHARIQERVNSTLLLTATPATVC
jgi:hypothetical protein